MFFVLIYVLFYFNILTADYGNAFSLYLIKVRYISSLLTTHLSLAINFSGA